MLKNLCEFSVNNDIISQRVYSIYEWNHMNEKLADLLEDEKVQV